MAKLQIAKGFTSDIGQEEGVLADSIITSQTVDREGDSIKVDGLDFSNFVQNPILLWAHNSRAENRPPIGRVEKIWKAEDGKVHFRARFDMGDSFAADIYRKFKERFLNAFSIGFIAKEMTDGQINAAEVLEFSAVPIPANPDAMAITRSIDGHAYLTHKDWVSGKEAPVKENVLMDLTKKEEAPKEEAISDAPQEDVKEEPKTSDQISDPVTEEVPQEQLKVETPEGSDTKALELEVRRLVKTAIYSLDQANKLLKKGK